MEDIQRLLRLVPREVQHLIIACSLSGLALDSLHRIFHPLLDPWLTHVVDPSNINIWNCMFASLPIVAPVWFATMRKSKVVRETLKQIDLVEAAMERVGLQKRERVTIRREEIQALADAAKQNFFGKADSVNLVDVANQARPGLIEDMDRAQPR
jgi:hypothetical protein